MCLDRQSILSSALELWRQGNALEAGKVIFRSLPNKRRPEWASNLLRVALLHSGIKNRPIERVLYVATHPDEWSKAHGAFEQVRNSTLAIEQLKLRSSQDSLLLTHLFLAELVAKVTYNETYPEDAFDDDSGWWIAVAARDIINCVRDEEFSQVMWSSMCSTVEKD